jgi:hypothetical protein
MKLFLHKINKISKIMNNKLDLINKKYKSYVNFEYNVDNLL